MARLDLVCLDCRHAFEVLPRVAIKPKQKRCPECGSEHTRQTVASYLRNGPLSNPDCGAPSRTIYG
jgi:putative FmdB family regulatory protein